MNKLLKLSLFFLFFCFNQFANCQIVYKLKYKKIFAALPLYVNEPPENDEISITSYPATKDILQVWQRLILGIRNSSNQSLLDNIIIQQSPINNIYSYQIKELSQTKNIIFYDKDFFTQFDGIKGIDVSYLMLFSLAHEIGHFINGDVKDEIHSIQSELKADEFAYTALCNLQMASEDRINNVLLALAGATDGFSHPRKGDRIKNASRFFNSGRCISSKVMEYEDFSTLDNQWKFWTGREKDYYNAEINPSSKSYILTLTTIPNWGWTWIPFASEMDKLFNENSGAQISFDFSSNSELSSELFGFMSYPECVNTNTCPGGSHYDLWFEKYKQNDGKYKLQARFFYNDNCGCASQKIISEINKSIYTGAVSNIRIVKYENKYTVYCDDQVLISFNVNGSIVNKIMFGVGTHYLTNFKAQVL